MPKRASTTAAKRKRAAQTRRTRKKDWRPAFLAAFEETAMVTEAAKIAGVGRATVYEERQRNEEFAVAWADVEERAVESMESEAYRRAVKGVDKPVFHAGEQVGTVKDYSDTLLIFMLKARRPETYREVHKVEHGGSMQHQHTQVLQKRVDNMAAEELDELLAGRLPDGGKNA